MIRNRLPGWLHVYTVTDDHHGVSGFELLFDVLVAFAFAQVITVVLTDPTLDGAIRGAVIFLALWGCWMSFCWAANTVRADAGTLRGLHVIALAGMVLVGLSMTRAFTEPGLNHRILVFLAAYLAIRLASAIALYLTPGQVTLRDPLTVILAAGGTATFIALSTYITTGHHLLLWLLALACETLAARAYLRHQKLTAPGHLAERYAFIVIIGLDMCLGGTAQQLLREPINLEQILLITLAVISCVLLWWIYFGPLITRAEHHFTRTEPSHPTPQSHQRLAVRYYSLLHIGVVGGLLAFSLGLRAIARSLTAANSGHLGPPLAPLWAAALTTGLALVCATTAIMWITLHHKAPTSYLILAALSLAATPFLINQPALIAVAILTATAVPLLLVTPRSKYSISSDVRGIQNETA